MKVLPHVGVVRVLVGRTTWLGCMVRGRMSVGGGKGWVGAKANVSGASGDAGIVRLRLRAGLSRAECAARPVHAPGIRPGVKRTCDPRLRSYRTSAWDSATALAIHHHRAADMGSSEGRVPYVVFGYGSLIFKVHSPPRFCLSILTTMMTGYWNSHHRMSYPNVCPAMASSTRAGALD